MITDDRPEFSTQHQPSVANPIGESNPAPQPSSVNLHFTPIFQESIAMYKKYFAVISGLMLMPIVYTLLVEYLFPTASMVSNNYFKYSATTVAKEVTLPLTTVAILIGIVGMIINYLSYGASIRHLATSAAVGFQEAITQVLATIKEAIILTIRIFIYTYAWIIILLMLAVMAVTIIGGGVLFLAPVFLIASVIFLIILIKRMLAVTFAFPIFLSEENQTSKQALEQSLAITRGHLGTIFVNYLILGILAAIVSTVYVMIVGAILDNFTMTAVNYHLIVGILMLPLSVLFGGVSVVFIYIFMRKAQEK